MTQTPKLQQRLLFFLVIGVSSTLVHVLSVLGLVRCFLLRPLIANLFAFLLAFQVSFFGHKWLTFAHLDDDRQLSLPHFFIIASTAGLLNEFLYFLLLHYTHIHYLLALILVLGTVSVYTFTLSKLWACR